MKGSTHELYLHHVVNRHVSELPAILKLDRFQNRALVEEEGEGTIDQHETACKVQELADRKTDDACEKEGGIGNKALRPTQQVHDGPTTPTHSACPASFPHLKLL